MELDTIRSQLYPIHIPTLYFFKDQNFVRISLQKIKLHKLISSLSMRKFPHISNF
jgi:hypothetical protein